MKTVVQIKLTIAPVNASVIVQLAQVTVVNKITE